MKDFWAEGLQNHRKGRIKKLILLIFFLLIIITAITLVVVYCNNEQFRNWCDENVLRKQVLEEETKYIQIDEDENLQVYAYDKYICILRKKTLEFYNRVGNKVGTIEVDINNAEFASAGRYLAISEKNGQKFYLISDKEKIFENEIEGNITQINVSRNGYVSIVISNTSYKSVVGVYNNKGKEIFKTNLVTSRVVDISISQDSKYLAIAEVDISGIIIKSSIQVISIELAQQNSSEAFLYKYEADTNKLILNIEYQEKGKLICMYNDSIEMLDGNQNTEILKFENKKISFVTVNLNNRIVLLEEVSIGDYNSKTKVNIINPENNKEKQYNTSDVAKSITTYGKKIAVNFGTELHIIDTNGFLKKKYISDSEINDIVMTDNLVGIVYRDRISIINF